MNINIEKMHEMNLKALQIWNNNQNLSHHNSENVFLLNRCKVKNVGFTFLEHVEPSK